MNRYLSPQGASLLSLLLNADTSALPDDYVQSLLRKLDPNEGKRLIAAVQRTSKGHRKKWADSLSKWAEHQLVISK